MYSSVQQLRTKNLLNNLSKKTAKQAIPEIEEMMNNTVSDEKNVILSIIFDIDFRNLTMLPKIHNLNEELVMLMKRPNFVANLSLAMDEYFSKKANNAFGPRYHEDVLTAFIRNMKFTPIQIIIVLLSLARTSHPLLSMESKKILRSKIVDLTNPSISFAEVSEHCLVQLFISLGSGDLINESDYSGILQSIRRSSLSTVYPNLYQKLFDSNREPPRPSFRRISAFLVDLGKGCASSVEQFRSAIISSNMILNEEQLADMLTVFVDKVTADMTQPQEKTWDLEVITSVLGQECKALSWIQVIKCFDTPSFSVKSDVVFQILTTMIIRISGGPVQAAGLMGNWKNKRAQYEFLVRAIQLPPSKVDFSSLITPEQYLPAEIQCSPNICWACLPVYSTLLQLANSGFATEIMEILKNACANFPEYAMINLCQAADPSSGVRMDLLRKMLPLFSGLRGSKSISMVVLKRLSSVSPDIMVTILRYAMRRAKVVSDMAEVDSRLKALGQSIAARIDEESAVEEILPFLCYRADRGELNLEEKLRVVLERNPQFIKYIFPFCKEHLENLRRRNSDGGILSVENLALFIKLLQISSGCSADELKFLIGHFQQFQNASSSTPTQRPDPIESEANSYFQKIYTSEMTIPEVINMLKNFKSSTEKREQDIFRVMIHNLLDEYRFFQKYPEKELQLTGILFGSVIQNQLISSMTLAIALRYILEALRKDPEQGVNNEKLFKFGQIALEQFRSRLGEWAQYCTHLVQIPHLAKYAPDLYKDAKDLLNSSGADSGGELNLGTEMSKMSVQESSVVQNQSSEVPPPSVIEVLVLANPPVLVSVEPPEHTRDKIQMILNNVDKSNLESKILELKNLISPDYFTWFADFLVGKIGSYSNLHFAFLAIADAVDVNNILAKVLLDCAYNFAAKYLSSSKIISSSSDRQMLRNIGVWIGCTTLARNKPILQKKLNLKSLLLWGYETGHLIAVCPFVGKILDGIKESKVFRPPNPWLMAILSVLKEIHELEDIKMNIKFEVQVLLKGINYRIEDVPTTDLLKQCRQPKKDQSNQDFNSKVSGTPNIQAAPSLPPTAQTFPTKSPVLVPKSEENDKSIPTPTPAPLSSPLELGAAPMSEQTVIPNLASHIIINPSLQFFTSNPAQKRFVSMAVDRGIRELIQSIVDRAVTIAGITTKMIILKDFSTELNEQALRHSAHMMISNLAGSFALVTCKEPLRVSIGNHLRGLLSSTISDQGLIDHIVQLCSQDNLEIGCMLMEKAAMERAIHEIDETLAPAFQLRRKMRETNQPFVDSSFVSKSGKYPKDLPDPIKPKIGGLTHQQLLVYESFQRSRQSPTMSPQSSSPQQSPLASIQSSHGEIKPLPTQQSSLLNAQQAMEAYQLAYSRLDVAIRDIMQTHGKDISISTFNNNSEFISILRSFRAIAEKTVSTSRVDSCLTFAERLFVKLLESIGSAELLRTEAIVLVLESFRDEKICDIKKITEELVRWLNSYSTFNIQDENTRKMLRVLLSTLLRMKLLKSLDIDNYFTTFMDQGKNMIWVDVALDFVKLCLSEKLAATYEFARIFDTVSRCKPTSPAVKKHLQTTLTELKALSSSTDAQRPIDGTSASPMPSKDFAVVREHVTSLLDKWFKISGSISEQSFGQYLQIMHQYGVLKTEEAADKFFRVSTELCAEHCIKSAQPDGSISYTVIDGLSKLLMLLVRQADKEASDPAVRANLLNRILSAVGRSLLSDHEQKKSSGFSFDQRPYFRILSNMIGELGVADSKKEANPAIVPLLGSYYQTFMVLQPFSVPGFAFAWVQLISHRCFLPHLLMNKQRCWSLAYRLLSLLLLFLYPLLKETQLSEISQKLYKATLRIVLVLLHDFPDFLVEYHMHLCDIIAPNCVQLRNVILSAFPRSVKLVDPLAPNFKVELVPDIFSPPRFLSDYISQINERNIRQRLDSYMLQRTPPDVPSFLIQQITVSGGINVSLMNIIMFYVGSVGAFQLSSKVPFATSPAIDIFKSLLSSLEPDGRYLVFSFFANQLRYPNSHTYFFYSLVLHLFADAESDFFQEQIVRVLLERLIASRPHPWGLLITFFELVKNPKYGFWNKPFIHCAPEINNLFESVLRRYGGNSSNAQQQVSNSQQQPSGAQRVSR